MLLPSSGPTPSKTTGEAQADALESQAAQAPIEAQEDALNAQADTVEQAAGQQD